MARTNDEDVYRIYYIPGDYKNGTHILGKTYTISWLLQGVILALIPVVLFWFLLPAIGLAIPSSPRIVITIVLAFILGSIGIAGINNESIVSFIGTFLNFKRKKRTAYFNPRVKTEMTASTEEVKTASEMLPRDKFISMYNKYKDEYDKKYRDKALAEQERIGGMDLSKMYFLDDAGVIDKPVEFMTEAEYKEYRKQRLKARKKKAAEQKKMNGRRSVNGNKKKETAGNTGKVRKL